jgi:dTDP-glucose pyrophosphorylase
MSLRKAIVLAAGKGTRLRPLTLAIPKEMIRVGIKPAIEHAISVLKAGGIKDVLVIVGRNKEAILNYLGSGERLGIQIYYRIQEELKGTAHAVYQGKDFIADEDFAVIYGDNYLKPYESMREIVKFHEDKKADATLVLHPVEDPRRFGIVKIDESGRVLGMIEKPTLAEAERYKVKDTYLNIAGLLLLKPSIFKYIEKTEPGKDGELWLTDSIELMRRDGKIVYGFVFKGARYDLGTFESVRKADELEQMEKAVQRETDE